MSALNLRRIVIGGAILASCVSLAFVNESRAASPAAAARAKAACIEFNALKPKASKVPVTLTITNNSGELRAIMRRDPNYVWIDVAQLEPGQSTIVKTFATHPLIFTDGPGNCIETLVVSRGQTRFDITVKSPGFEPE